MALVFVILSLWIWASDRSVTVPSLNLECHKQIESYENDEKGRNSGFRAEVALSPNFWGIAPKRRRSRGSAGNAGTRSPGGVVCKGK